MILLVIFIYSLLPLLLSRFSHVQLCRPHRWQPTRLPRPWDSPRKDTEMGCHFPLQCRKVKNEREVAQSCPTLSDPMDCSPRGSSVHGICQARVLEWVAIAFSKRKCSLLYFPYYLVDVSHEPPPTKFQFFGGALSLMNS